MVHVSEKTKDRLEGFCDFKPGPRVAVSPEQEINTFFVHKILVDMESLLLPTNSTVADFSSSPTRDTFHAKSIAQNHSPPSTFNFPPQPSIRSSISTQSPFATTVPKSITQAVRMTLDQAPSLGRTKTSNLTVISPAAIHPFWNTFGDHDTEMEYRCSYLSKCSSQMMNALWQCFYTTAIMTTMLLVVFPSPAGSSTSYLSFLSMVGVEGVVLGAFGLMCAGFLCFEEQSEFMLRLVKLGKSINYQTLAPGAVVLIFFGSLAQLNANAEVMSFVVYQFAFMAVVVILSSSFTRIRSFYMSLAVLAVILLFFGSQLARSAYMSSHGYNNNASLMLLVMLAIHMLLFVPVTLLASNFSEHFVRSNYLINKESIRHKFEIEDVKAKTDKLLFKLLPKEVIQR